MESKEPTRSSLRNELYRHLRARILSGQLTPGSRLPSSRALATQMGVSRNTVLAAYEQLWAEGYLEGRLGSGTYVTRSLPDELLSAAVQPPIVPGDVAPGRFLSERGERIASSPRTPLPVLTGHPEVRAFTVGLPDVDTFPKEAWGRLVTRRQRESTWEMMRYNHPAGYEPLRRAIAMHLATSRGVRCTADQIIIVSGSQQALDFCARMLVDPGDPVWVEDPGYLGARSALAAAGARFVPVPVDEEGLDVATGIAREPNARLAVVTPSHQFPLGYTMSLKRRLALIEWASRTGSWVLEDDYDADFRYVGRPLNALQGIDGPGRVIYIGTFSKALFPALRLGYLVAPPPLVEAFICAHLCSDMHAPVLQQAVLADFIQEGHFERHLRRMRLLYAERQAVLVEAAERHLRGLIDIQACDSGLHVIGWLAPHLDEQSAARNAAAHDVDVWPLSLHTIHPYPKPGLILGYAPVTAGQIRAGTRRLAEALNAKASQDSVVRVMSAPSRDRDLGMSSGCR